MSGIPGTNTKGAVAARDILVLAACFGVVSGLVEGAGLLLFQKLRWMNWLMQ